MANLILRPAADGHYQTWQGFVGAVPHASTYDLIDEADADGDSTFVSTSTAGAFTVTLGSCVAGAWPRATRVASIRVVATVRTTGTSATASLRLRSLDTDWDTDTLTVTSPTYIEVDHTYDLTPSAYAWDLPTINRIEAGLVFVSGDELRCTKLEVFVHYELFPYHTLAPTASGASSQWTPNPATSPPWMTVGGVYDGDRSYITSSTLGNVSLFEPNELPASLHPVNVDRVSVKALIKNTGTTTETAEVLLRSSGTNYRGGTNTGGVAIPPNNAWHLFSEEYLNDPAVAWPSGNPAATAWTAAEVNALEVGVENMSGGVFRCTSLATEVWLAPTPPTTIDLFPTADGYHQDWTTIVPGPNAWAAVNEDPPDDATSYVLLDAATAGTAQYASFTVNGVGSVPAGERIYNVETRYRVRLGNLPHSTARVAPVLRSGGETYVGRPQLIEGTAAVWFDVKWDFHTDPHAGIPWANLATAKNVEFGLAALDGAVLLSRVRAQAQTVNDYRGVSTATDLQLTTGTPSATYFLTRSQTDGTIFAITEFAVGTGGYTITDPKTAVAVTTTDTALANEAYRGRIEHIEYGAAFVDYWCRVPREVAQGGIGELGLFAEILWSPIPGEVGTSHLFALMHHPCQTRHVDDVHFYIVRIEYP